jgi:hypothetical protein
MVGIYLIKNRLDNRVYIGSSNNIERRFRRHRTELKTGRHSNPFLSKAYQKYGKDAFDFIIIELCKQVNLIQRELYFIAKYRSLDPLFGYNLKSPVAHPSMVNKEYSKILSKAKKGKSPVNLFQIQELRRKQVDVYKNGKFYKTFKSLKDTEISMGINRGNVYNYLNGKTKGIKNFEEYEFKYR